MIADFKIAGRGPKEVSSCIALISLSILSFILKLGFGSTNLIIITLLVSLYV